MNDHHNQIEKYLNSAEGRPLRRLDKSVKDVARIHDLLTTTRIGYLGLYDKEGAYTVPLNFTWYNNKIYFHGSNQGRKMDAILNPITVCFTVAQDYGTITHPVPAETGTSYFSAMIFGHVHVVENLDEATSVLQSMLEKYVPGYFSNPLPKKHVERYRSGAGAHTTVCRLEPIKITAKEDIAGMEQLFYPGRKQEHDITKRNT